MVTSPTRTEEQPHGATIKHGSDAEYAAQKKRGQGERGKPVAPTKRLVTMCLSATVIEHFKAGCPGWQTRIERNVARAVMHLANRTVPAG